MKLNGPTLKFNKPSLKFGWTPLKLNGPTLKFNGPSLKFGWTLPEVWMDPSGVEWTNPED